MLFIGGGEAAITLIGVILVGFTLHATRRAAKAAEKTVIQSETQSRQELRAYVGVEALAFNCENFSAYMRGSYTPKDPAKAGVDCNDFLCVTVRNFGQTPAFDVVVFTNWVIVAADTRPEQGYFDSVVDTPPTTPVRVTLSQFILQREQRHISRIAIWNLQPMLDARDEKAELYIAGRIYYRDAFGRPWRTKFCFSWQPTSEGTDFEFVPYQEYNGEDQTPLPT
jgi:hypothetical protein